MKIVDVYSPYHNKIKFESLSPRLEPLLPPEYKQGTERLTRPFIRKRGLRYFNLSSGQLEERVQPISSYKTILELSCRGPYCPISFTIDTVMGVCPFQCIYCFSALTGSSLMTSFFDSSTTNVLAPRFAKPDYIRENLNEVLNARGAEPIERETKPSKLWTRSKEGATSEPKYLKKASAQRVPLRMGTRNEAFMFAEASVGAAKAALEVIKDHGYPLIINTKSDLPTLSPYFELISSLGDNVAIQVTITHTDDEVSRRLEPGAPSSTQRWKVLKTFNEVGINAMLRMEPAAAFLNVDDDHLERYFTKANECGVKNFMGDSYHHTVKAEEIKQLFYRAGFDFDRMWNITSEFQITGSLVMEKAMYYAKQHGIRAGTFNFHSLPYNDDPVCCMIGDQFGSWSKYSMIHFLKGELIEKGRASFRDLDEKYYGMELHPDFRRRIKDVWNLKVLNAWNPDFVAGVREDGLDEDGNLVWKFDSSPSSLFEGYDGLLKMIEGRSK